MTVAERRRIGRVLRDFYAGREDAAMRELRFLAREYAPTPPTMGDAVHYACGARLTACPDAVKLPPIAVTPAFVRAYNGPLPKPRKRIVDRKALQAYRAEHVMCELVRCLEPSCPEPHHLVSRKRRGDDVPGNLIALCVRHHREWHTIGPVTWTQKYLHDLTADARSKVMTALRTPEDAHD